MANITTISGPLSIISRGPQMTLRIGDRPAFMKHSVDNVTNGDRVTAAGIAEAEFNVLALLNESTQMIYSVPDTGRAANVILAAGSALSLLTLPLAFIGVFIFWRIWVLYRELKAHSANVQEAVRVLQGATADEAPAKASIVI